MNSIGQIVAVLSLLASLVLVLRSVRGRDLARSQIVVMALVWAAIILLCSLFVRKLTG